MPNVSIISSAVADSLVTRRGGEVTARGILPSLDAGFHVEVAYEVDDRLASDAASKMTITTATTFFIVLYGGCKDKGRYRND